MKIERKLVNIRQNELGMKDECDHAVVKEICPIETKRNFLNKQIWLLQCMNCKEVFVKS